jgi:adenine-specific DNA-methyltransferase
MNKKLYGIYYTPSDATRILCQWAIQGPMDFVLEPSFGACGFLEASRDRLSELNSNDPNGQLFGCDIDARAFSDFLQPKFNCPDLLDRFKYKDFMQVRPNDFPVREFDVVIGNPPYVSHHNMSSKQKDAIATLQSAELALSCKASLWAYFVVHSLSFLKKGGRVAWILPSSFLYADYSSAIKEAISKRFRRSLVLQLGERLFSSEGTDESTVILLADGWDEVNSSSEIQVEFASNLKQLEKAISSWQAGTRVGQTYDKPIGHALVSPQTVDVLDLIEDLKQPCTLETLGSVIIGIVTGANDFFIINREIAELWHLRGTVLKPILSKFNMVTGLSLMKSDLNASVRDNFRCLLVNTNQLKDTDEDLALRVYLWSFPEKEKYKNKTFRKRAIWHRPDDHRTPDAFLSYMLQGGPRLVLNRARTTCTNTVHRVFFKPEVTALQRKASVIMG